MNRCRARTAQDARSFFGRSVIQVGSQDLTGVEISLVPGAQFFGHVSAEAGEAPPVWSPAEIASTRHEDRDG